MPPLFIPPPWLVGRSNSLVMLRLIGRRSWSADIGKNCLIGEPQKRQSKKPIMWRKLIARLFPGRQIKFTHIWRVAGANSQPRLTTTDRLTSVLNWLTVVNCENKSLSTWLSYNIAFSTHFRPRGDLVGWSSKKSMKSGLVLQLHQRGGRSIPVHLFLSKGKP